MIDRCTNPNNENFALYKDRGICAEFRASFKAFLDHIGPRPSSAHSVDRIDNERGYELGNVRWATPLEQGRNKRNNVRVKFDGRDAIIPEVVREVGIPESRLRHRIKSGWSVEKALSEPALDARSDMTGVDLSAMRSRLGLTQAGFGKLVDPPLRNRKVSALERSTLPLTVTMARRILAAVASATTGGRS